MFGQDDVCALGIQTIPTPKPSYTLTFLLYMRNREVNLASLVSSIAS